MGLSDEEFKQFEKKAMAFLRTLDFTPVGYYPYDYSSDVLGYLKLPPPFRNPIKTLAEIMRTTPTKESIEGFQDLARGSLADRMIMICPKRLAELGQEIQQQISSRGIEFFDAETVSTTLDKKEVSASAILEYSGIYGVLGPPLLAAALPSIARQEIPEDMKEIVNRSGLQPWQVFEGAVFSVFHYCFGFTTKKLGEECLFKHEPEGVVITGLSQRFAFLYECKSTEESYAMTSDHELRYKDYIKEKANKIPVLYGAPLSYFIIIAPAFSGDIGERRQRIFRDTQVLVVFMPASVLSFLGKWACDLPSDLKRLIDLRYICRIDELIVSQATCQQYVEEFERERRAR
jgi:hypothetical protein